MSITTRIIGATAAVLIGLSVAAAPTAEASNPPQAGKIFSAPQLGKIF